ncbi:MAG: RHS repeat-associated core domain-containing protein, partial [Gammaproteobacteria bacterium]|nr:RHS repeat-associated core domain-containing protein [Gammaproteobacteria bacterium]
TLRVPVPKTLSYTYDDNGSMLTKSDSLHSSDDLTFDYNTRNQMIRAMKNGTVAGLYDYNADGMRVRHYSSERGDVDYYYDGKSVIEERRADGTLLAHYRYADRLFRLDTETDSQYYHHDALGSTVNLTGSDGSLEVSYRLDPWGRIREMTGVTVNRHIFTGQEYDENTGLIYFGARLYEPETARFVTQDTYLGEQGTPPSLHRYQYDYSNPTVYLDPTGNYTEEGVYNAFFERYGDNEKAM